MNRYNEHDILTT